MIHFWVGSAYMLALPMIGVKRSGQVIHQGGPLAVALLTIVDSDAEIMLTFKRLFDSLAVSIEEYAMTATEIRTEYRERNCVGTS